MKTFTFTLPDNEAEILAETINTLRYAYADLSHEDAIKVLMRLGWEEILRRLQRADRIEKRKTEQAHAAA